MDNREPIRRGRCECADKECPKHRGYGRCDESVLGVRGVTLYRCDMDDRTGTRMCQWCADDAFGSGLFR